MKPTEVAETQDLVYRVDYDTHTEVIREPDAFDPWDVGDDSIEYNLKGIYTLHPSSSSSSRIRNVSKISPHATEAYLVYVVYSTGCTFGTSRGGGIDFVLLTTDETEALELETAIYKGTYDDYKPWLGYFESLDFVRTERLPIRKAPMHVK